MAPLIDEPEVEEVVLHVMLVDDEDDYHLITRMMLRKAGFTGRFTSFLDPATAMEHLRSGHDRPDVLLVDINMPATNGFEFLAQCSKEQLLDQGNVTVVMCSSSNRPMDLEMAKQLPAIHEYIEKPLTTDQFHRIVDDHCRRTAPYNA